MECDFMGQAGMWLIPICTLVFTATTIYMLRSMTQHSIILVYLVYALLTQNVCNNTPWHTMTYMNVMDCPVS